MPSLQCHTCEECSMCIRKFIPCWKHTAELRGQPYNRRTQPNPKANVTWLSPGSDRSIARQAQRLPHSMRTDPQTSIKLCGLRLVLHHAWVACSGGKPSPASTANKHDKRILWKRYQCQAAPVPQITPTPQVCEHENRHCCSAGQRLTSRSKPTRRGTYTVAH
jgi:hypothetical protein